MTFPLSEPSGATGEADVSNTAKALARMRGALEAIRDYEPVEVVKDDFAYDRMVEAYRKAATDALGDIS